MFLRFFKQGKECSSRPVKINITQGGRQILWILCLGIGRTDGTSDPEHHSRADRQVF
jgi:hypothetical protein